MEEDIEAVCHVGRVPSIFCLLCVWPDQSLMAQQDVQTIVDATLRLLRRIIGEAVTSLKLPQVKQSL